jgi:hypothetical protein
MKQLENRFLANNLIINMEKTKEALDQFTDLLCI